MPKLAGRGGFRLLGAACWALCLVAQLAWAGPPGPQQLDRQQVEALLVELAGPHPEQRRAALESLLDSAPAAARAGAVPVVVERVRSDSDLEVRELGLRLLGAIGPQAADAVVPLALELIEREQPGRLRGWAAYALGKMRPPIKLVAKRLIPLLLLPDDFLHAAVQGALLDLDDGVLVLLVFLIGQAPEPYTRWRLVDALGEFGPRARSLVPELERLRAAESNDRVRESLFQAILRILPKDDPETLRLVLAELERAEGPLRRRLLAGLGELGPAARQALPLLRAALVDPDREIRSASLGAIASIVTPESAGDLPARVALLLDSDWLTGVKAADALLRMGSAGVAALLVAGGHPKSRVRRFAWEALAKQPPWTAGQFEALGVRIDAEDSPEIRQVLATILGKLGPIAIPTLRDAFLREAQPGVRGALVHALAACGPDALDDVASALSDADPLVRQAAAYALGELGPAAGPAVAVLLAADLDESMRAGLDALPKIGAAAIEPLRQGLRHRDARIRERAAYGFGLVGPPAAPAVRSLCAALSDPVADVRQWAAWSIGQLGPGADYAIEDLQAALTDPADHVREFAARSLGQLGPGALQALPDLIRLLSDRALFVGQKAAEAIGGFGPAAAGAVPQLLACLAGDRHDSVRQAAAAALGRIGVSDAGVLAALRSALADPKARVRWAAAEALLVIGAPADRASARQIIRRAPDEAFEEDADSMKELNRMLQPLEPPPAD